MKNWTFETLDPAYGEVSEGPAWDGSGCLHADSTEPDYAIRPASGSARCIGKHELRQRLTFDAQDGCTGARAGRRPMRGACPVQHRWECDGSGRPV